ncbi:DUF6922 domain-containing protein [Bacteroides mediterraneensis]|nr:hypothetical protein [Bacteroides mediterraneensis]
MEKFGHKVLEEVPDLKEELKSPTKMTGLEKVSPSLLWEYNLDNFDWEEMSRIVIQRVCERGHLSDFYAILKLYGYSRIREIIKNKIKCFYHSNDLLFACYLFDIDVKEAAAYNHAEKRHKILDDL